MLFSYPMRILYILQSFPNISETFVANEIRRLTELGHTVHVVSLRETAAPVWRQLLSVIRIVRNEKIDHIHCHFAKQNVWLAHTANKILRVPYTFTTHAYDIFIAPDRKLKAWAMNAKKVITISEFNRKYMHEKFAIPFEKIAVIPCGIPLERFGPVTEYKTEPFRLISLSRLVEKKGYPYLIEACQILKEKHIPFTCEIGGYGIQEGQLLDMIEKYNLTDRVRLIGSVAHEKVAPFLQTGSVFILPSIRGCDNNMDGIPNVLMEAMASRIPVISTKLSGIPELVENGVNGITVPEKDANALAEAIVKIKNDIDFTNRIRKNGRKKVEEKFNLEKNVLTLLQIFQS